jgi:hypothetical protein
MKTSFLKSMNLTDLDTSYLFSYTCSKIGIMDLFKVQILKSHGREIFGKDKKALS